MSVSAAVLLVADLLHPIDILAVELFLNRDMAHGRGHARAVPVLFAWRKPHDIAGTNFLDWAALALRPAATGRDDQRLAERVRMPGGASARLEGDQSAGDARGIRRGEQRIDAHRAREPIRRAFIGRLRSASFDFHGSSSSAQRPESFMRSSGYRAPCTLILDAAASISRKSSAAERANNALSDI